MANTQVQLCLLYELFERGPKLEDEI